MKVEPFKNASFTDFAKPENRQAMSEAVTQVRSQLGRTYDIVIGGEQIRCEQQFESLNPSSREEVVGIFQKGTSQLAEQAIKAADSAFLAWSRRPAEERVELMLNVSRIMKERRFELAAWMVIEVGKSWVEADADVAEAIDFCEFYSREMLRLAVPQPLIEIESEETALEYIPLGVGVIIPPGTFL